MQYTLYTTLAATERRFLQQSTYPDTRQIRDEICSSGRMSIESRIIDAIQSNLILKQKLLFPVKKNI